MKNTIIEIRTYDENYDKHEDFKYKFRGCVSVIVSKSEIRIIEHEINQKTTVINLPDRSGVTVRNWGVNV